MRTLHDSPGGSSAAGLGAVAGQPLPPRLQLRGVHAGYGGTEVLHGIDLDLAPGRSLCLVGPNGAGKSTVLNALAGLADVTAGELRLEGRDLRRMSPAARLAQAGVAYVLQDSSVFPDLSVEQNLRLGGYCMPREADARAAAAAILERHPTLAARRAQPARVLSGGERRLLEITRAFMMSPRLLLVDEPSIGLDPQGVTRVFETLRAAQREGMSILLVEQNVRVGLAFADEGVVLVDGRVVRRATGADLLEDPALGRMFIGA